jgi:hypothetical protein
MMTMVTTDFASFGRVLGIFPRYNFYPLSAQEGVGDSREGFSINLLEAEAGSLERPGEKKTNKIY